MDFRSQKVCVAPCRTDRRTRRSTLTPFALYALLFAFVLSAAPAEDGWIRMFDGKTLNGWKVNEYFAAWSVENGEIVGRGEVSHLFYIKEVCTNCEFKAEVKINKGGNSGMFFRAQFGRGWLTGYEAQVDNGHPGRRTGSLYKISDIAEQLVPDDTWFAMHIIARGNHIVIKVNDRVVVDVVEKENRHAKGYLALQQHDPGGVVCFRNVVMKHLP